VPQDIQLATPPQVGDATTEFAALAELKAIAGRNKFQAALGDFRLVRGIGGIPARIFQHVALNNRRQLPPQVGDATTEFAALAELKAIAGRNKRFKSYIGMGYTAYPAAQSGRSGR
jgi:glycine cleavage system pyridoxal-binding protein P